MSDAWRKISSLSPFRCLSDTGLARLERAVQQRSCGKNEVLQEEGEPADVLYVLPDGGVELFASHEGGVATVAVLDAPVLTPMEAIVRDGASLYSVRTFRSGLVFRLGIEAIRDVLRQEREFACAVAEMLVEQQANARTANQRLAAWILQRHTRTGGANPLTIDIPKKTLASCLGMGPENLSRALLSLGQHGLRCKGRQIYVDDPMALAQFAKINSVLDGAPPGI